MHLLSAYLYSQYIYIYIVHWIALELLNKRYACNGAKSMEAGPRIHHRLLRANPRKKTSSHGTRQMPKYMELRQKPRHVAFVRRRILRMKSQTRSQIEDN